MQKRHLWTLQPKEGRRACHRGMPLSIPKLIVRTLYRLILSQQLNCLQICEPPSSKRQGVTSGDTRPPFCSLLHFHDVYYWPVMSEVGFAVANDLDRDFTSSTTSCLPKCYGFAALETEKSDCYWYLLGNSHGHCSA